MSATAIFLTRHRYNEWGYVSKQKGIRSLKKSIYHCLKINARLGKKYQKHQKVSTYSSLHKTSSDN